MKTSIEWLKEYSDIQVTSKELCDKLTLTGTKVETLEIKGGDIKNVVVGKILEINRHPNADKLIVTKVDVKDEIIQIVTGADNVKVGDIIPVAKNGSELPGGIKIKTGKLRDVESCGMMCAVSELGLKLEDYPGQIDHGIMILPSEMEKKLGEDITEVLNLKEEIIDFEITPNRADCLSIEGLGRETAATLGEEFKNPHKNLENQRVENKESIEGLNVSIEAPDLCYRYVARVVKNVKIQESPDWLKRRLRACDIRPINNIVDITNYVMLELGQPMHAFDINSISDKTIIVRRANENEKITTLDDVERNLDSNMLVIADAKKPVAIAGVMGGQNSEIENDTKTVVFESACFNGPSVRLTAKKVGLRTESSSRFEKGLSPENTVRAADRAVELVKLLNAGDVIEERIDVYPTKIENKEVPLDVDAINNLLGTEISKDEMIKILEKLEMKIENDKVTAPYFRSDIERVADLAEEVVRFYGYDKLGTTLINTDTTIGIRTKIQKIETELRSYLKHTGFSEIYTYGFINQSDLEKCQISYEEVKENIIKIDNPLSEDYTMMRVSTLPSIMKTLGINQAKKNKDVKLFDISKKYVDNNNIKEGEVPEEDKILTIGMYGEGVDFYSLKGILENIFDLIGLSRYQLEKEVENPSYHPGRCANIKVGIDKIGTFGEIHPVVNENYEIVLRSYVAELNISKLIKYLKTNKKYAPIPKFPALERDIAVVVNKDIEVGKIEEVIKKQARKLLEEVKLFDIYESEKLGENKKSVAYALKFRISDRTLTDEEVNVVMEKCIVDLEKQFGAELRK